MNKTKITEDQRAQAKRYYDMGYDVTEIAKRTGISFNTVKNWIYGNPKRPTSGWKHEREKWVKSLEEHRREVGKAKFTQAINMSTDILLYILSKVDKNRVSLKDAKDVAYIIASLHKVIQLEEGNPTEILDAQVENITVHDVRVALEKDKFLEFIENKTREVESDRGDKPADPFQ